MLHLNFNHYLDTYNPLYNLEVIRPNYGYKKRRLIVGAFLISQNTSLLTTVSTTCCTGFFNFDFA